MSKQLKDKYRRRVSGSGTVRVHVLNVSGCLLF